MPTNRKTVKTLGSDRVIFLNGEVTEINSIELVKQLFELDKKSDKDILVIINSFGGSVEDGLFIVNSFKLLRSDVAVLVPSNAQSITTLILAAGTKGKRIVMPGAAAMMHGSIYTLSEMPHKVQKSEMEYQEKQEHYVADILLDYGYKHREHSLASEYSYYVGKEIIDAGLADVMVNSLDELCKVINL
jgi:ATP-dependent Clp protease protease subunit